jgi:hypothetical protein
MNSNIDELKKLVFEPKQNWWYIDDSLRIMHIEYLCVYPFNNPNYIGTYDIIIDKKSDEPIRIYRENLVEIIEKHKHIKSYEDAKVELIRRSEQHLETIKKIYGRSE